MNYSIDKLHVYTLNVGYAEHNGDWNWKNVRSPFARLYLVVEGHAKVEMQSTTYDLTPGHLYFIPAFTTHSYVCDSHFVHYYIHIYEDSETEESILDKWDFPFEVDANGCDSDLCNGSHTSTHFSNCQCPTPTLTTTTGPWSATST